MKFNPCFTLLLLFVWLNSCRQDNSPGNNSDNKDSLFRAEGTIMAGDTILPPELITAGTPLIIQVGEPEIDSINTGLLLGLPNIQTFTTDDGLALDAISYGHKSAICDKNGILWFGTAGGGVSRYDGQSFTTINATQGLANNMVFSIHEDKEGNFWFGTAGGGVSRYDGRSIYTYEKEQGLISNMVYAITEDRNGNLWFGTAEGVSQYNGKSFGNLTADQGLADNSVLSILEDKDGNMWFGTNGGGVSRYDGHTFTNYTIADGLANNTIVCITEDKSGNIWFGSAGRGVSRYDGHSFTNFSRNDGLGNNNVFSITETKDGTIWFGTNGGGVSSYDGKKFTSITTENGLANDAVFSITEDQQGNVWFGTDGGGVSRYEGASFANINTTHGLAYNTVLASREDSRGNTWFGTSGGGLSVFDGNSFSTYTTKQGLPKNAVFSIMESKSGDFWIGTDGGGVCRYDGKVLAEYTKEQGLVEDVVFSIAEDKSGNLWFGTIGGLSKFDGQTFTNFTTAQGLANNVVLCVTEDKNGNLWLGTNDGVSKFDGRNFTNYTRSDGLADDMVFCITEDEYGNLWFATGGGGVSRYDGNSFASFTNADGLPDNMVTQIIVPRQQDGADNNEFGHYLFIGTNSGIGVLTSFIKSASTEERENNEYSSIRIPAVNNLSNDELLRYTPVMEIYNTGTGYPVKDVNSGQTSMYADSKGIIWAGTGADKTGLVRFDYSKLKKNNQAPVVLLNAIKVDEENISWYNLMSGTANVNTESVTGAPNIYEEVMAFGRALSVAERDSMQSKFSGVTFDSVRKFYAIPENLLLPYEHNHITFQFAAVEPARPYLVHYQYILEGYDKEWSPLTNKTEVSYGNIDEGTYTFRLKARGSIGVWSEPLIYSFRVLSPWYRTWWMYSAYVIALGGFIAIVVWWNGRNLRSRAKELKQKVNEATSKITEQKHLIEDKHKEITDSINYAERIQRSFLATKDLLNENLKDYFVFFNPKAIVSGDFYWAIELSNGNFALATADSTGHGVPGAIMSLLNITSLESAIKAGNMRPSDILNVTRENIIERLKKDGSVQGGRDGMDASLICFEFANDKFTYAAANLPVWVVRNNEIIELTWDKMPVGKHDKDTVPFTNHEFQLRKGDIVYTLTDGMADQFGGPKGKKFMYRRLKELCVRIAPLPMHQQKEKIEQALNDWKGDLEQVDDICLIGVRV